MITIITGVAGLVIGLAAGAAAAAYVLVHGRGTRTAPTGGGQQQPGRHRAAVATIRRAETASQPPAGDFAPAVQPAAA